MRHGFLKDKLLYILNSQSEFGTLYEYIVVIFFNNHAQIMA